MVVSIKTGFYAEMEIDMKKLENKCMLITYSDSMGHNLADLNEILDKYFKKAVGGIHILPFFPSSGDRGFAPMDYHKVDPAFGDWNDVEQVRRAKKEEIGLACSAAIYAGIDVNGSHYSLTEHDQTELMAQLTTVKEGAAAVPYHADGELCRMFTAEEFTALATAATAHVFYHRTYCNHVNAWIKRADLAELDSISYGVQLPADLAASMAEIVEAAGGGGAAE